MCSQTAVTLFESFLHAHFNYHGQPGVWHVPHISRDNSQWQLTKYVTALKWGVWIWWRILLLLNLEEERRSWGFKINSFYAVFFFVVVVFFVTRYKAGEVWLDGFKLVYIILSLLIRDLPRIIVAAGLSLDLVVRCCWGHRSYRCAFLRKSTRDWNQNHVWSKGDSDEAAGSFVLSLEQSLLFILVINH